MCRGHVPDDSHMICKTSPKHLTVIFLAETSLSHKRGDTWKNINVVIHLDYVHCAHNVYLYVHKFPLDLPFCNNRLNVKLSF